MSGEPKGLRWIATSALPIDLLAHAARHAATETRADKAARTWRAPSWVRAGVAFVGMWGACAAVFSVDPLAFASPWRWLPLVAGAGLVSLAIARRRVPSLRPERGQGLVVGPTSLVVIDARSVAVVPAERLAVSVDHIELDGQIIDSAFHDPEWRKRLEAAVTLARSDAGARAEDRWRAAADAAGDAARETWTARHATTLAIVGAGVCVALFLEAGPIHARARFASADRRADWSRAVELDDNTAASLGTRLDATQAWTEEMRRRHQEEDQRIADAAREKRAAAERAAAERRKGQLARLDAMQKGEASVDDILAFKRSLPNDDEVLQTRVHDLLRARCVAQYPDAPGGTQRQRVQRLLLRMMCVDDTSVLTYDSGDGTDSDDARTVADALAADLQTLSVSLGRTISARARSVSGDATLAIDIVVSGKPKPAADNPRRMEQDCTVTVKIVDDDVKDALATRQYVTNGVLGTERR